jgi:hypothetical protein
MSAAQAREIDNLRAILRRILTERFSEAELHNLVFDLGIAYDILPGSSKEDKARELIAFFNGAII